MDTLSDLLAASQARHTHLCPRQVLGVRIALAGLKSLEMDPTLPRHKRSLLVISETDGCFVDGIEVTARVSVGHRSLKIEDYGKIAATFVDVRSGEAVRVHLIPGVRELARHACPEETRAYFAQLRAYQIIPDRELLNAQWVTLNQDIRLIRGTPRQRSNCIQCGQEIINGREVMKNEMIICVACAGNAYYHLKEAESAVEEKPEQANDFLDLAKPGIKACQPDNTTHA